MARFLFLLTILVAIPLCFGWSYHLIAGKCKNLDNLNDLYFNRVRKGGIIFWTKSVQVEYYGDTVITCLRVVNQWNDGTGGSVRILSGGVGHCYMVIELRSQFCRGMSFNIEAYGDNFKHYL